MTTDDPRPLLDAHVVVHRGGFAIDLSVVIQPGEVVLLTGENGIGKSTFLRAIAGSLPIDAGRIALGDTIVDDPLVRVFVPPDRRGIGMVPQDARPFPHMTVLENVAFGLRARGVRRDDARARSREQLDRHGLLHLADRRGHEVSGGEGRRVVLARALVGRPRLLLLDEPLASIDADARAGLLADLGAVIAAHATSVLLVTHDPDEVGDLADRSVHVGR